MAALISSSTMRVSAARGIDAGDKPGIRWDKMRGPNLHPAYFVPLALPLIGEPLAPAPL